MFSSEQQLAIWWSRLIFSTAPKHGPGEIVVRHDLSQYDGGSVRVGVSLLLTDPRVLAVGNSAQILVRFNLSTVGHIPGALFHHDAVNITGQG